MMTLGSLFDGIGGFPLAGMMCGITPVWASEIEPFPLKVTAARFPNMKQLGSVTEIDGGKITPVDIITFGSPCQDLSVAGKQLGIHEGQRSNLFFEAVRIIKEMREADERTGRTDEHIRPRFAVWENVPGAFSSNKGADFKAVLQALASVRENGVSIPQPKKWGGAGCVVGNGWSIAWRVYDAQYWGVPQRRKRIYLIADFASERAGEILFEREGLRGDSSESGAPWKGTAADAERSVGGSCFSIEGHVIDRKSTQNGRGWADGYAHTLNATDRHGVCYGVDCRNGTLDEEKTHTIQAKPNGGISQNCTPSVCYEVCGLDGYNTESTGDVSITIRAGKSDQDHVGCVVYRNGGYGDMVEGVGTLRANGGDAGGTQRASSLSVYDARGNGDGSIAPTVTGDHNGHINDYMAVLVEKHE